MIFVDSTPNTQTMNNESPCNREMRQDTQLQLLQQAVDNLNLAVSSLQTSVNNLNSTIDDKYLAQTQTLSRELSEAISNLEDSIESSINTEQIVTDSIYASDGHIDELLTSVGTINNLSSQSADILIESVDTSTINTLTVSDTATIAEATVQYLTAVNAAITNYDITNLESETFSSDAAEIGNITAQIATIARINAQLITVADQGAWREPIGQVDNTDLLKLTIPAYSGITNIVTENDELNVSVINNNLVSFNQNADYPLYRIDFEQALNVDTSYSSLEIDQEIYDLSVTGDFAAIEFTYDGTTYRYKKSEFTDTITVDENLSLAYADNTITFTTTNDTTLLDVIIYDSTYSGENNVILYLADNITYKVIHLGDSSYTASYSEMVDRTYYSNNVNKRSGTFISDNIMNPIEPELSIELVSNLPQNLGKNTIYIVYNDSAYYSKDGNAAIKMGASITQVATNTSNIESIQNSIGQPDGIATLDSEGHLPISQMPTSALIYKGQWDASSGAYPVQTTYTTGDFYIVSVAGTVSGVDYYVGDWIIWNGTAWDRSANANLVYSVNGQQGAVVISLNDLGGQEALVSGTNIKTINNNSILGSGNITLADLGITIV